VLRDYRRLMSAAAEVERGALVDTAGDGLFFSFPSARGAVSAALAAQRSFRDHAWPAGANLEARIGIHTGEPVSSDAMLVGLDVHRASRICAAGHGGQILLSLTTHDLLRGETSGGALLRDLGEHRLKDLPHPERVFQASATDLPSEFPPLRSLDNWPNNLPTSAVQLRRPRRIPGRGQPTADDDPSAHAHRPGWRREDPSGAGSGRAGDGPLPRWRLGDRAGRAG
ncbi:MAG: adenylate/guanylate cyclase domain-containing protein, partial [Chloroflexota bacterium]